MSQLQNHHDVIFNLENQRNME